MASGPHALETTTELALHEKSKLVNSMRRERCRVTVTTWPSDRMYFMRDCHLIRPKSGSPHGGLGASPWNVRSTSQSSVCVQVVVDPVDGPR